MNSPDQITSAGHWLTGKKYSQIELSFTIAAGLFIGHGNYLAGLLAFLCGFLLNAGIDFLVLTGSTSATANHVRDTESHPVTPKRSRELRL